ncbi:hypothetical protein A0H81_04876 [Grifola frondosa]|uniref:Uncharacterized protein n=1 Tax=Grifola frondosa TaxID=5627 RepID=A0A1C7MJ63_GRIFR|nr:hypothetical protein A0H81_04876 [Grifola frondosa]
MKEDKAYHLLPVYYCNLCRISIGGFHKVNTSSSSVPPPFGIRMTSHEYLDSGSILSTLWDRLLQRTSAENHQYQSARLIEKEEQTPIDLPDTMMNLLKVDAHATPFTGTSYFKCCVVFHELDIKTRH